MANYANVELLAPAGSIQSFFAALDCGADAVFCGLTSFSARAKAKNFNLEELEQLVSYGHHIEKKIYVALNTLVQVAELQELVTLLEAIETIGVDGLIIQDLGLYRLAHKYFPTIPLHASTQMLVHNLAGVQVLERLGFERAVLARELSLTEIAYISENSQLEIEHFIHGALCYSMSGHCLFSSYIDGKSGNRGRCAQPCRRRYHLGKETGFHFSTGDLSAIELIPELVAAGVMSLKIEGRMKSAEYVAAVVTAYRTVLDSRPGEEQNGIDKAKKQLEAAMGRKSSPGFLPGLGGADIVLPQVKGGIGKIVGQVERVQGGRISFRSSDVIHVGDRIRIQPLSDGAGQGFTVRSLFLGKKSCKVIGENSFVTVPLPPRGPKKRAMRVGLQDQIFKVATGKTFTLSEEACLRKLRTAPKHTNAVSLRVDCNQDLSSMTVWARVQGIKFQKSYEVDMIQALRTPLSRETLLKVFSHTGVPTLSFADLELRELPTVVIKPSRLKAIRRDFYGDLEELLMAAQVKARGIRKCRVISELKQGQLCGKGTAGTQETRRLYIVSDRLADLNLVRKNPELRFVFPLNNVFLKAFSMLSLVEIEGLRIIWDLPSVCFDDDQGLLKKSIKEVTNLGFTAFRLNNIGQLELMANSKNMELLAGPWLYGLNTETHLFLAEHGCSMMCLSIEDDRENIRKILQGGNSGTVLATVYGRVDLFTSRISGIARKGEVSLQNDQGDKFHLRENRGLTLTSAEKAFSLLGSCGELQDMGLTDFILDLRGIGFGTSTGKEIVAAFWEDRALPGTVKLNFKRGLL